MKASACQVAKGASPVEQVRLAFQQGSRQVKGRTSTGQVHRLDCIRAEEADAKPYYGLVKCFQVALSILDPGLVGETTNMEDCSDASPSRASAGFLPLKDELFRDNGNAENLMQLLLKIPWNHYLLEAEPCLSWKMKCFCLQILPMMGPLSQHKSDLDVLDLGLQDEAKEVRSEAIVAMLLIFLCRYGTVTQIYKRLEFLLKEENEKVKKSITISLGYLACLYGSCDGNASLFENKCKLFLKEENNKHSWTGDQLFQGFWCSVCGKSVLHNHESFSIISDLHNIGNVAPKLDYTALLRLFFTLLYDESEEVQHSCVAIAGRILVHMNADTLHETKTKWIKSIDYLLLHRRKSVREAFSRQISCFLEYPIFTCLFLDEETTGKTKEQFFLDKIRHGYEAASDPEVFETLLEATAGIMVAADIHGQLFLSSLIVLLDQLENPYVTVRMTASRLICRSCLLKGGLEQILAKFIHIRNEVYNYLSLRLAKSPEMVEEFAATLLDVKVKELVKRMVPVVLPQLVIAHQDNDEALVTLDELAKYMERSMVELIVDWIPKVLAFALYQADEGKLDCALQFYRDQTGTDKKELFAAHYK